MKRSESQSSDRRRKISYAIHQEPISRRKKHRVPQVVGLAFFLVLGTVITVGLVFGIGPSDTKSDNSTVQARVSIPNDLVQGPSHFRNNPRFTNYPVPTRKPLEYDVQFQEPQPEERKREELPESCVGKEGKYRFATVNTNTELCSNIGVTMLAKHHGTAVDAAIASMACMGVVNPQSSGLGGGFFMLVYKKDTNQVHALDARVSAPARSTRYMYEQKLESAKQGYLSVATPGSVQGFYKAHEKFGTLPWRDLFTPAIKLALDGFPVNQQLHSAIKGYRYKVHKDASLKSKLIDSKTGDAVKVGTIIDNAPLARTLQKLAENGPNEFYNGSIARDIVLDLVGVGGSLAIDDLSRYASKWRPPIQTRVRDNLSMYTMPQPGSGALLSLIANVMDGYAEGNDTFDDVGVMYHRVIEATKFALARKLYLGDPDFAQIHPIVADLDKESYADEIRDKIGNMTHDDPLYYGNMTGVLDHGTGLVIVRNPDGDVVVATTTVGEAFGSGILGKYTGIVYNDGMADFDLPQTPPTFTFIPPDSNYIQPMKRPLSSMSPTLVLDPAGDVVLAMAAGGGTGGISAQILVLLRILYQNQDLKTAIDSPFVHNDWLPPFTKYERTLDKSVLEDLRRRGHVMSRSQSKAFVHAITMKHQFIHSYADARKLGCVDGY